MKTLMTLKTAKRINSFWLGCLMLTTLFTQFDAYADGHRRQSSHRHGKICKKHHHHSHHCHSKPQSLPVCSKFDRIIYPSRMSNSKHLHFNVKDLEIFLQPNVQITSANLHLLVKGKRRLNIFNSKDKHKYGQYENDDIQLAINGIQAHGNIGKRFCQFNQYINRSDVSDYTINLNQLTLNGTQNVAVAIDRIVNDKGNVKITVNGKNLILKSAYLEIIGSTGNCPDTNPTPTPTTIAPVTVIQSTDPVGSVVASNSMSINFSADQTGVSFKCSLDGATASACTSPQLYSSLSNGAHNFKVVATNAAGQVDATGATYSWTVNTVIPTVTISNSNTLKSPTNSSSISLSFTSAGATSYQCALDNGAYAACTSPVTYNGLMEGTHKVSIKGISNAGSNSTPAVYQWVIDQTLPIISLNSIVPDLTNSSTTSKTFTFSADETATFECNIDNAGFSACSSPLVLVGLTDGNHTIAIQGTDLAGNTGLPANYSWIVDTIAPVITLGKVVPAVGPSNSKNISVEFFSNEPSSFTCVMDGIQQNNCTSPFSAPISSEGAHNFQVIAIDQAGNSSSSSTLSWMMDYSLPLVAWGDMLPSAGTYINSNSFQAIVTSSEPVTLATFLNGLDIAQPASPIVVNQLSEGPNSIQVQSMDAVGNMGNTLVHDFIVDLTAPQVMISGSVNSGYTNQTVNTINFSANENANYECNLNNAGFAACVSPMIISGLAEGSHLFEVRATDLAGNVGNISSINWIVDVTAPVSTLIPSRLANESISFNFSANEAVQAYECSLDGAAFQACNSPVSFSSLSVGNHSFSVRSVDLAGNTDSSPASFSWTVAPPMTTTISNASVSGQNANFSFSSNIAGATFVCSLDGSIPSACVSGKSYSGLTDGNHQFQVFAVDSFGTVDTVGASYSWTIDTTAPVVLSLSVSVTNTTMTVTWTTNEPATSKVKWGLNSLSNNTTAEDMNYVTSHSVTVTGLTPNSVYSYIGAGSDQAGNAYTSTRVQVRLPK